jgi:hypothetical protein
MALWTAGCGSSPVAAVSGQGAATEGASEDTGPRPPTDGRGTSDPPGATGAHDGTGASTSDAPGSTSGDAAPSSDAGTTGCRLQKWFLDADHDGFGASQTAVADCDAPSPDHTTVDGDCDDAAPDVHPGADETCDGIDDDCDGGIDEGSAANASCGGCTFVLSDDAATYFALCSEPLSWADARDACDGFGPGVDLAQIDNADDDAIIFGLITGDTWFGASDLAEEGHWVWVDGSDAIAGGVVVGYDGWGAGEPNGAANEHCGELDLNFDGWIDVDCTQLQAWLCRHPA